MNIESLALNNYRNYELLDIELSKGTNILYGNNAQGKTNILESIYMTATTKSHRGSRDRDIIRFEEDEAHIKLLVSKNDISHRIDMHLKKNKNKGVAVDGLPIRKISEIFGLLNIIFFSPEDLSIIKNGPVERRRFMDMELCQLSRLYYSNISNYNKVLNQRNNLLRQIYYNKSLLDTIDVWDDQLILYGTKVIKERENFINMLEEIVVDIHSGLTEGREKLEIKYNKSVNEDEYKDTLLEKRSVDCKYESTQYGPHRDDISFFINGIDVRMFGSQGQQRTAALSLKLAEIELVKKIINDSPILLLDDVMSELDSNRRNALLNRIKDVQTIITCTGYDDFIRERIKIDKIYYIENGKAFLKSGQV
ncbi:DNA replication and repair protein RecF [Eubacterium ruminantium]|nr:DNA replication and repair protein RecF [Eubacterium ruminantium]